MDSQRIKYIQDGTGQVAHLVHDRERKKWAIELFVGGPQPNQRVSEWDSREEAEAVLTGDGFLHEKS